MGRKRSRGNCSDDGVPPLQWGDVVEETLRETAEEESACYCGPGSARAAHLYDECQHRVVTGGEDDPLLSQNGRYHFQHVLRTKAEEGVVQTDVQLG